MARIEINGLTKRFGDLTALDAVTVSLEKGQIVGLLGPNGSGKTTLIKILNGLLTPTEGSVSINGMEPGIGTKKIVAYLPDRNALPDYMNPGRLMDMYGDFFGDFDRQKAESMVDDLGIDRTVIGRHAFIHHLEFLHHPGIGRIKTEIIEQDTRLISRP